MIDLTPLDVRKKRGDFRRVLRGYDPSEVDTFLELVEARLESLVMENLSLAEKVQRLESQLGALEGREKAVQEALVTAQKLREEVHDQSEREASSLRDQALRDAKSLRGDAEREAGILRDEAIREAALIRDEARREAELLRKETLSQVESRIREAEMVLKDHHRTLEELERRRLKFLKGFRTLLEREMDAVEVEESRAPLEDTPLELNFRGWREEAEEAPEAEGEEEEGAKEWPEREAEGELPEEGEGAFHPMERVVDLGDGEEATDTPIRGWGAQPGDEPPEGEFSDILPLGVFESRTPDPSPGPEAREDATTEARRGGEAVGREGKLRVNLMGEGRREGVGGEALPEAGSRENEEEELPEGSLVEELARGGTYVTEGPEEAGSAGREEDGGAPGTGNEETREEEGEGRARPAEEDAAFGATVKHLLDSSPRKPREEEDPLWLSALGTGESPDEPRDPESDPPEGEPIEGKVEGEEEPDRR